jgi:uncharacterized protein
VSAPPPVAIHCSNCDAVCCRLTVVVMPGDDVPEHMVDHSENGPDVMARGEDGWCVALDRRHMRCGIYQTRPDVCRRFAMGGPYCAAVREDYSREPAPGAIPLVLR